MNVSTEKFKAPAGGRGIATTPERKALFEKCLDEGWTFFRIQKEHNVSWHTLNKLFPGRATPMSVAAKRGAAASAVVRGKAHGQPDTATA